MLRRVAVNYLPAENLTCLDDWMITQISLSLRIFVQIRFLLDALHRHVWAPSHYLILFVCRNPVMASILPHDPCCRSHESFPRTAPQSGLKRSFQPFRRMNLERFN